MYSKNLKHASLSKENIFNLSQLPHKKPNTFVHNL